MYTLYTHKEVNELILFIDKINGKFTTETREKVSRHFCVCETGVEFGRHYVQTAYFNYISQSSCLQWSHMEGEGEHSMVLVSAHLLQVGRQQEAGRQELLLFVHHFSLT